MSSYKITNKVWSNLSNSISLLLVLMLSLTGCLAIDRNTILTEKKIVSKNIVKADPVTLIKINPVLSKTKIDFSVEKLIKNHDEEIIIEQYRVMEDNKLRPKRDHEFRNSSGGGDWCLPTCFTGLLFPVVMPYYLIKSYNMDLGLREVENKKPINLSERNIPVMSGELVIQDIDENENAKNIVLKIENGKCSLDLNRLKSRQVEYPITFKDKAEGNDHTFNLKIEYEEGDVENSVLVGQSGSLGVEIRPIFTNAAFIGMLTNNSNHDISLDVYSDKVYFIVDGQSIMGELDFYYSHVFKGNYPDILPANSYVKFNIRTYSGIVMDDNTKGVFKISSNDENISLKGNKDKRAINNVIIE